ncbi:MAG: lamin tail domain-containing protein, partial [Streptosporangiaceae bacterium]
MVISQVYGGGGNLGAPLTHDYVELFNRSAASVDLSTYSVQYASATGTGAFAANVAPLSGTLAPGRYFLLELAAGATPAAELPTPDATGSLNLSGTAGKVALVSSTTGLACNGSSTACSDEQKALIADLVGFGTANFFEGAGAAPATGNTTALVRAGNGCTDTDVNSADFTAVAPAPRNGATTAAPCGGVDPEPTPTPTPTHDTCDTPVTQQIADIQGAGTASPLAGQTVRFEGIVTADHQGPDQLSGFFVQDDTPDADATTSDAVFVYSTLPAAVGDRVRVTGKVAEFGGATELTGVTDVNVCGTGTIAATVLDLPLKAGVTRERYEGTL